MNSLAQVQLHNHKILMVARTAPKKYRLYQHVAYKPTVLIREIKKSHEDQIRFINMMDNERRFFSDMRELAKQTKRRLKHLEGKTYLVK